jgi:protein-arginine kinase
MVFARDEHFGYVNSCPSNLGTGMRASVRVPVPSLTNAGHDVKAVCRQFGLSACGTSGEHTPIGTDGLVDLSPGRRLFVSERDVLSILFEGLRQLGIGGGTTAAALLPRFDRNTSDPIATTNSEIPSTGR